MKSSWVINEVNTHEIESVSEYFKINKSILSILHSRNIKTPTELDDFINPKLSMLHSPFMLDSMYEAVERIKKSIDGREKIGIFSDSDIDGLTSLTILYRLFLKMGMKIYFRYPVDDETYGLTIDIIDEFIQNEVKLIITVDSGIRDIAEISHAKKNGIDVIITDHHEQDDVLPDAIIVNPKKNSCSYPFKDLAGVGVAFKICHALLLSYLPSFKKYFLIVTKENGLYSYSLIQDGIVNECIRDISYDEIISKTGSMSKFDTIIVFDAEDLSEHFTQINRCTYTIEVLLKDIYSDITPAYLTIEGLVKLFNINRGIYKNKIDILTVIFFEIQFLSSKKIYSFLKSILEYVAIGSIADVMPLIKENRILVYHGIKSLMNTEHTGLRSLINNNSVNSKFVSWDIAPILNSPGRFGQTDLTANFFLENSLSDVETIITKLRDLNDYRKNLVEKIYIKIIDLIARGDLDLNGSILFFMSNEIPDGLAGLIASKLANVIFKPVIIASLPGKNGLVKGSGRSYGNFNFFEFILPYADMFERIGGHSQAFGFAAKDNKILEIMDKIKSVADDRIINNKTTKIDLEIDLNKINNGFIKELSLLEPMGKGNEPPVFLSKNVIIDKFSAMGAKNKHGKFSFKNSFPLHAIGWNIADKMSEYYKEKKPIDIVYSVEINNYRGVESPQLIIIDIDYFNDGCLITQFH